MQLFDAHCHLQFPQYDADREDVLSRMRERDMGAVVIGTDLKTSKDALELAKQHDSLWAAVGLHPNDNIEEVFNKKAFEELAKDPKVVAIGECGLDYFRSGGTDEEKAVQKERFQKHIDFALCVQKPLIIHCRNAHEDMLEVLFSYSRVLENKDVKVIIHFFTGTGELAQKYLDLGCYLSFPGPITYTDMYDESIRVTPLDRILAETDAPFAAPVPHRGKRNEPLYVAEVIKKIAVLKGLSLQELQEHIAANARNIFKI